MFKTILERIYINWDHSQETLVTICYVIRFLIIQFAYALCYLLIYDLSCFLNNGVKYEQFFAWNDLSSSGFILGDCTSWLGPPTGSSRCLFSTVELIYFSILESACKISLFEFENYFARFLLNHSSVRSFSV
jgi:hypothetical protein